jgi:N6-L-threonylcarbamoyladenine synthase
VLDEALAVAGVTVGDVDGIAVTYGPGLAGSLLVGVIAAKALAYVHDRPLLGVNHLEGHAYAAWLVDGDGAEATTTDPAAPDLPAVVLVVSGGHTLLAELAPGLRHRLLGSTIDDAAGEAFDKVGRLLGLGYPGGPAIERAAGAATARDRLFPRAWLGESYDFSFSGLKTAAVRAVASARSDLGLDQDEPLPEALVAELAWGFQESVVDVLTTKTIRAAEALDARTIVLGGGVASNGALRRRLTDAAAAAGRAIVIPRPGLCTDNGAMIGAAGALRFAAGERSGLDLDARPSLAFAT